MTQTNAAATIKVWDLPVRLFHWTLAAAVAGAFLTGEEDAPLAAWHHVLGWAAALLIAFRVVWGVVGGEHARFAAFLRPASLGRHLSGLLSRKGEASLGHNPLGGLAIVVLLSLTAAAVATGLTAGEDLHETVVWTFLAMIGVHVAAVVAMSLASRENLVRAMITGAKSAASHPGARDARPAAAWALPFALVIAAGAAWAAVQFDPRAFTPGPSDRQEQGGETDESDEHGQVDVERAEASDFR